MIFNSQSYLNTKIWTNIGTPKILMKIIYAYIVNHCDLEWLIVNKNVSAETETSENSNVQYILPLGK